LDINAAKSLVLSYLGSKRPPADDELVICDSDTRELDYGWVFFYNSKMFIETGDLRYALAGNAPLLVDKKSRTLIVLGTAKPIDELLREYEEKAARTFRASTNSD
jgi:hypothetical protein